MIAWPEGAPAGRVLVSQHLHVQLRLSTPGTQVVAWWKRRAPSAEPAVALRDVPLDPEFRHGLAFKGFIHEVRREHEDAIAVARTSYVSPHSVALVYSGLGRMEQWREANSAALEERSGLLAYLSHAAWLDPVRDDPFFDELRRKIGLPEPSAPSATANAGDQRQ